MTPKNAAFLALVGTLLLTLLLAFDFFKSLSAVIDGLLPAMTLLRVVVYLIASLSVTVFFFVFHRTQSK